MKAGIAFEILVKRILISVGFSEVQSDGTYIYDGSSGQMLQGLGEAHNADVLLEPPVQTPFLNKIRLLVECKDYKRKVGLDVVRDALGLREDVNHFELGITFPGGHVERGESFTDAVIREVWEETGLKISEPKLCGIKDWMKDEETRYIVLLYKTDKFEGIVTSSEEGDVFWLTLDEMKQRKLAYGMDKMLEVFLNDNISEYFFFEENGKWIEELK